MTLGIAGRSNSLLLVALLLLMLIEPLFHHQSGEGTLFGVMVSGVLIAAVWAVSRRRGLLVAGLSLAGPAFIGRWALHFVDSPWLGVLWTLFAIAFLAFTAAVVLWGALAGARVTADAIAGAICVYLLLGVIWAFAFSLIELVHPGSFLINGARIATSPLALRSWHPEFLYLSLITLSTVGYGDIIPLTPPARVFAALEGVVGQLYLAVLIARLVGRHVPQAGDRS